MKPILFVMALVAAAMTGNAGAPTTQPTPTIIKLSDMHMPQLARGVPEDVVRQNYYLACAYSMAYDKIIDVLVARIDELESRHPEEKANWAMPALFLEEVGTNETATISMDLRRKKRD